MAAQGPLAQPVEPVEFAPWREERSDGSTRRYSATFPSPVRTGITNNDAVQVQVVLPLEGNEPFPVVVILHYWGATDSRLEESLASRLAAQGVSSVIVPLPYHLSRTPPGSRSGEYAVRADADALSQTILQSVLDVRRTLDWIESRPEFNPRRIGVAGTSLGALIAAAAFAVDHRLDASVYLLGGVDFAGILWNSSRVVAHRDSLRRQGFSQQSLRERLAPYEPLTYMQPDDRPSYVIGARHDTVVPVASTEALIRALGDPHVLWIDTGHFGGALVLNPLMESVSRFLVASLDGRPFTAPSRLYAPTVRIGVLADPLDGVQVGLGVDVWRLTPNGELTAAVFATPRDVQVLLGFEVSRGLWASGVFKTRRTTWGLFWHTVL